MLLFDAADTTSVHPNMHHHPGSLPDEIRSELDGWLKAVSSRSVTKVVSCYAEGTLLQSTLLPTVAAGLHIAPDHFMRYFHEFLSSEDLKGTVDTERVIPLGPGYAAISGRYTFRFRKGGGLHAVPAEYTFIYRSEEDGWKIIHHHSSALDHPTEVLQAIRPQMEEHYRYHLAAHLKGNQPQRGEEEVVHVQPLDGDFAYVCGINRLMHELDGCRRDLPTRFTLIFRNNGATWQRVHAHMSPVPGIPFAQAA